MQWVGKKDGCRGEQGMHLQESFNYDYVEFSCEFRGINGTNETFYAGSLIPVSIQQIDCQGRPKALYYIS